MKTIWQAAISALVRHLDNAPSIQAKIFDRWPEPDEFREDPRGPQVPMPKAFISIVQTSAPQQANASFNRAPIDSRPLVPASSTHTEYLWSLGFHDVKLQLDVWAKHQAQLENLDYLLWPELNRGNMLRATRAPFGDGLVLNLDSTDAPEQRGAAAYSFEGPERIITPAANNRRDWRSSYTCDLSVEMAVWAPSPRIATIILQERIGLDPSATPVTQTPI